MPSESSTWFASAKHSIEIPNRSAIERRVSPGRTTYSVGLESGAGVGVRVGIAVGVGVGSGAGVGAGGAVGSGVSAAVCVGAVAAGDGAAGAASSVASPQAAPPRRTAARSSPTSTATEGLRDFMARTRVRRCIEQALQSSPPHTSAGSTPNCRAAAVATPAPVPRRRPIMPAVSRHPGTGGRCLIPLPEVERSRFLAALEMTWWEMRNDIWGLRIDSRGPRATACGLGLVGRLRLGVAAHEVGLLDADILLQLDGESAVDDQGVAGDERGVLGAQE